jgi:threonine dehydrogenase-like Zn-dependent dehydrogenase
MRIAVAWCGICGSDLHEYRFGEHAKILVRVGG